MNDPVTLDQVLALANRLDPRERKELAEYLLRRHAELRGASRPGRRWREIRGSVPHPLCGEDAQAWVSRGRREADDSREGTRR
jgi:hypothetical protein